jgi:hypothetical protein
MDLPETLSSRRTPQWPRKSRQLITIRSTIFVSLSGGLTELDARLDQVDSIEPRGSDMTRCVVDTDNNHVGRVSAAAVYQPFGLLDVALPQWFHVSEAEFVDMALLTGVMGSPPSEASVPICSTL